MANGSGRIPVLLALAAAALVLGGCGEVADGTTGGGGAGGGPSSGGGGSGGVTTMTTSTTTTSTTTVPLTCGAPVAEPPLDGECDLLQQNCEPGETCVPGTNGTQCKKGGGLKGAGKPCYSAAGVDECQAGLFCIGEGIGFCTRPCCTEDDEPCQGGTCNFEVNFPNVLVHMCTYAVQCDLFVADTCKNLQKCQFVYPEKNLAVCTPPASKNVPEGEACGFVNECGSNQVCWAGTCRYNCKIAGGAGPGSGGCPDTQTCQPVYAAPAEDKGVCQPAPP